MGLSGPKKRTKLSSDPNNTAWSKSTDTFGHKILSAQGWKPGQLLGAENAAHAEHFTAANASHIKVALREDNLGLGAKLGRDSAETFGLSTLSNIFGRLNGKSDEVLEKQQSAQRDAGLRQYQTRKFGYMTFVSGGLLVGDKMEDSPDVLAKMSSSSKPDAQAQFAAGDAKVLASTTDKKRKRVEDADAVQPSSEVEESAASSSEDEAARKKHKKKHSAKSDTDRKSKKKSKHDDTNSKKEKRSKAKAESEAVSAAGSAVDSAAATAASTTDRKLDKAACRAAKQARKEDRAKRRAEREKRKSPRSTSPDTTHDISSSTSVAATPSTGSAFAGSRQAVRQRWIQQKRLASMDAQALNEILMLKTTTVT